MRLVLLFIVSFISFSTVAGKNLEDKLLKNFQLCKHGTFEECSSVLIGSDSFKRAFFSLLETMRQDAIFTELYKKSYGVDEYEKFNDAFKLNISLMESADFKLVSTVGDRAVFKDEEDFEITLVKENNKWKMDLEKSFSGLFGEMSVEQFQELTSLMSGMKIRLISLIENKANVDDVYKSGGLYFAATIYDLVNDDMQKKLDDVFIERGQTLSQIRGELVVK
ncbi:hypothetical protein [Alteromonas sp. W364]|uniref:hypothetical protein n=1 Tax=Alteromonas sp. W364 TaxID=3075610 RepID=UPI0028840D94|nr:hypothetical protein [Alteromonas sp. W364]MDT0630088.1 hypothetical protein [Alteromonas sp. W364]